MATTSQAFTKIAEVFDKLPATVLRVGRMLREHDPEAFPMGEQGRGRAAQVTNRHLTNLVIALAVADPITTAPQAVPLWRGLEPLVVFDHRMPKGNEVSAVNRRLINIESEKMEERAGWLEGNNLGEALEFLISILAESDNKDRLRRDFTEADLTVTFILGEKPTVWISGKTFDKDGSHTTVSDYYFLSQDGDFPNKPVKSQVSLSIAVFEALADLWADTLARSFATPTRQTGAGEEKPAPKTKKAPGLQSVRAFELNDLPQANRTCIQTMRNLPPTSEASKGFQSRRTWVAGRFQFPRPSKGRPPAMTVRIGLTMLPRRLAELTGQPAPTYRKCFDSAVENRFPAQFSGSRWTVDEDDLPVIAVALGMMSTPAKPARKAPAASTSVAA